MRYLLLAYGDTQILSELPPEQGALVDQECVAADELLRQRGHLIAVEAPDVESTATVRQRAGVTTVTDGPFIETKELLMGIFHIEAKDLNEAIQIASAMPQARFGPIEVRPIIGQG